MRNKTAMRLGAIIVLCIGIGSAGVILWADAINAFTDANSPVNGATLAAGIGGSVLMCIGFVGAMLGVDHLIDKYRS